VTKLFRLAPCGRAKGIGWLLFTIFFCLLNHLDSVLIAIVGAVSWPAIPTKERRKANGANFLYLILSGILFGLRRDWIPDQRNIISIFMSIELMLNE